MNELLTNFVAAGRALSALSPILAAVLVASLGLAGLYRLIDGTTFPNALLVFAGFSIFGSTIGVFMGASSSPIVTSVLPPIIFLIAGYMAYVGSKDFPTEVKVMLPGAVFLLLLNLLFSAFYIKFWLLPSP